jgi:Dolichyl-phosphate-mannose-protein mannosyltransferase
LLDLSSTPTPEEPPDSPRRLRRRRRWCLAILAGLLTFHAFTTLALVESTPFTSDENHYLAAGMALRSEFSFETRHTTLQGPLPYYANQLAAWFGAEYDPPFDTTEHNKAWGRLGMLVFTFCTLLLLLRMTWRHLGPSASVAAGLCYVLNPLVLGHGVLMSPDMALTAGFTLTAITVIHYLEFPGWRRAILLGLSLGLAMATKYLALLLVPATAVAVLVWLLRPADPPERRRERVLPALRDAAVCALVGWIVIHACYRFDAGFWDPVAHPPIADGPIAGSTVLRTLAQWLPDPLVRGIDYQMSAGRNFSTIGFLGELSASSWLYYIVALLTKLPVAFLVLLGISAVRPGLCRRLPRHVMWVVALVIAIPFFYLSVLADMQIGVRYVLPLIPLMIFFAVRPIEGLWASGRAGRIVLAGLFGWMGLFPLQHWPDLISAFNVLGGSRPYLTFSDSTFDWQLDPMQDKARERLLARHPGAHQMHFRSGARIGPVIVYGLDLWPRFDLKRGPVDHWLREFAPLDHEGAFYFFQLTENHFRLVAHDLDPRSAERNRRNLAVALLGDGKLMEVEELLASGPDLPLVHQQLLSLRAEPRDPALVIDLWKRLGRYDLVLSHPKASRGDVGSSFYELGRYKDCRRVLEAEMRSRQLSAVEMQILCSAQIRDNALEKAIVTSKLHPPALGTPEFARHEALIKNLENLWSEYQNLMRQIGARRPKR